MLCYALYHPSKHAGSDSEAFWLRPVMAIMASVQPESARIVYLGSNFPHPIRFRFSKEGLNPTVQNRPGSDLDDLVRFWPNASGPEASRCARTAGPGFWQNATSPLRFPVSDSVAFFHRRPGSDCARPAQICFGSG